MKVQGVGHVVLKVRSLVDEVAARSAATPNTITALTRDRGTILRIDQAALTAVLAPHEALRVHPLWQATVQHPELLEERFGISEFVDVLTLAGTEAGGEAWLE